MLCAGLDPEQADKQPFIASMGIYVFKKNVLVDLLKKKYPGSNDFGGEIIPMAAAEGQKVIAYLFNDYWEDIGTIKSFFDANLALAQTVRQLASHTPLGCAFLLVLCDSWQLSCTECRSSSRKDLEPQPLTCQTQQAQQTLSDLGLCYVTSFSCIDIHYYCVDMRPQARGPNCNRACLAVCIRQWFVHGPAESCLQGFMFFLHSRLHIGGAAHNTVLCMPY